MNALKRVFSALLAIAPGTSCAPRLDAIGDGWVGARFTTFQAEQP